MDIGTVLAADESSKILWKDSTGRPLKQQWPQVNGKTRQHWSSDQLNWSRKSSFFGRCLLSSWFIISWNLPFRASILESSSKQNPVRAKGKRWKYYTDNKDRFPEDLVQCMEICRLADLMCSSIHAGVCLYCCRFLFHGFLYLIQYVDTTIRNTEGAVWRPQYSPRLLYWPKPIGLRSV